MPERVTSVRLSLQAQQYVSGMREAGRVTAETGTAAERLTGQREAFNLMGRTMLTVGGLMAAGVGLAIAKFAEFDQAMSQVKAVTQETTANMDLLRAAALDAGGATVYTASEAANAIEELGKNGLSTAQILSGGLDSALALAAAGGLEVARAAEIAAITSKQFNIEGARLPHVADLMAAGAGKAAGDVEDLAQALAQSGLVAAQTGLSIEETTGVLAAFADNSLLGSDAGTSLRTMLLRLTPVSGVAAREMERLGIDAYDAGGEFIGMAEFAGQLQQRLGGLTQEQRNTSLSIIFGQDAIRGATLLYNQGAEGIQNYIDQTNDAGYAARVAADRLDNLTGDLEKLGGAWDTALIQSGSSANGVLRTIVQTATGAIDAFNSMGPGTQAAALGILAVGSAASLAAGAFFLGVPKVAEYRQALDRLGPSAQRASRIIGGIGRGIAFVAGLGAAAVILDKIASSGQEAARGVEETLQVLRKAGQDDLFADISNDVGDFSSALELLLGDSVNSNMERFGSTLNDVIAGGQLSDQVKETREQFATLGDSLAQLVNSGQGDQARELFREMAEQAKEQGYSTAELIALMPAYKEALFGVTNETENATGATDDNAAALAELQGSASDAEGAVDDLADAIRGFGSATLSTRDAEREFQAAIDDLTAAVSVNGTSLDINTEQGRENEATLDALAESAKEVAAARLEETGSHDAASEAIAEGRRQLILALEQFGITGTAAEDYADRLGLIPANVYTAAELSTASADATMQAFITRWDGKRIRVYADGSVSFGGPGTRAVANGNLFDYAKAFANGGYPEGMYRGGAPLYKFAEPETGWEALVSGRKGREKENIGYALEALMRLGAFDDLRYPDAARSTTTITVQAPPVSAATDTSVIDRLAERLNAAPEPVEWAESSVRMVAQEIAEALAPKLRGQQRIGEADS